MSDSSTTPGGLAAALGRIPSGLFILTVRDGDRTTGMLASWVQQAGFAPPMVTVALRKERYVADWARRSGRFVLNQVPAGNKHLLRHFGRGFEPGELAFEGLALVRPDEPAGPVLAESLAFMVVSVAGEVAGGDHVVMLGQIIDGDLIAGDGEPMIHIRRTGLHY